eukprot:gene24772-30732_t
MVRCLCCLLALGFPVDHHGDCVGNLVGFVATIVNVQIHHDGAVATDNPTCSQIGADILDLGGNAVDAAISAALCLGVISPASSGIGGGCYMLYYNQNSGESTFIDAREVAPAASTSHMFETQPMAAQDGGLAIAVLGEVKGLYLAYERYGSHKVPWKTLVAPAAKLAKRWTLN